MYRPRLTHARVVALLVVILAVAGCTNPFSTKPVPVPVSQDRSGRLLNQGETQSALPPVAALPPGWNPAAKNVMRPTPNQDKVLPARCDAVYHAVDRGYLQAKTKSYATYVNKQAALGVGIASHTEAAPALGAARKALRTCSRFRVNDGKSVQVVRAWPLRIPKVAGDSLTVRFLVLQGSVVATYDVVRIRVGHNTILADLVTPGTGKPNTKPLVTAAKNALLNLS